MAESGRSKRARYLRRSLAQCGLIVGLAVLAGCADGRGRSAAVAHPFAAETVTIAVPKELGIGETWKPLLDEWGAETGATARLVEYPLSESKGAEVLEGDLMIFPFARLGEFMAADRFDRIAPSQLAGEGAAGWLDLFPGLRERVLSPAGAPTLISLSCPVLTCYFRKDLLEKAELRPPESWDDYLALVESAPRWAPGLSTVEPWGPKFRATMFLARALPLVKHPATYSVFFDIDSGAPLIDSPGFVMGLKQALAAIAKMPPDVKSMDPNECRRLILSGKAAMAICFEPGESRGKSPLRKAGVTIGFAPLPGSQRYYNRRTKSWDKPSEREVNSATLAPFQGLAAGVAKGVPAKRADAAWNLLTFLGVTRYEQAFERIPKSVCRESQLSGAAAWISSDLRPEEIGGYLAVTAESLRQTNLSPELALLGHEEFRQALTEGLTAAIEGKASAEAALKGVAERWERISKTIGVERVRDSYRKCLGLRPAVKRSGVSDTMPPPGSIPNSETPDSAR